MPGRVIRELRGAGGFGYDVVFVPDDQDGELTSAEMTSEAKDAISHRGRALREIAPWWCGAGGAERACASHACCRSRPRLRALQVGELATTQLRPCARRDSNSHWPGPKPGASTDWATGATGRV